MRFHTEYLTFNTKKQRDYINVTKEVEAALKKSGVREGMILVSAMHITASVYVNDASERSSFLKYSSTRSRSSSVSTPMVSWGVSAT